MGFVIYDRIDRKLVGASQNLWFASEDEAARHLARMPREDVKAERYAVVSVPD
jgi:hypothetical protein